MFAAVVGQTWATAAHPYSLEVNGVDHIGAVDFRSIEIEMAGPGTNGSLSFELWDPDASVDIAEWDEVRFIEHAATRPVQFGGFVQSSVINVWATTGRTLRVRCVGYGVLLDKKAMPETTLPFNLDTEEVVQRLVALYGGIISAQLTPTFTSPDATYGMAAYNLLSGSLARWLNDYYFGLTGSPVVPAGSYLRGAIEYVLGLAFSEADHAAGNTDVPISVPGLYWVDSARMFRLLADGSASPNAEWQLGGLDYNGQYDTATSTLALDVTGTTYTVVGTEYERENIDLATSAYVVGGNAAGTGYTRPAAGHSRAGDLEVVISDTDSTTASAVALRGGLMVASTAAASGRGRITLQSTTPLPLWPGRRMTITDARLGLDTSTIWRLAGVEIRFESSESRRYVVHFGGGLGRRSSLAKRQGQYVVKQTFNHPR